MLGTTFVPDAGNNFCSRWWEQLVPDDRNTYFTRSRCWEHFVPNAGNNFCAQDQLNYFQQRVKAAKEHVRGELEAVFKAQFYDKNKGVWSVNDLKLSVQLAKKQQGKSKKPNAMDTSA